MIENETDLEQTLEVKPNSGFKNSPSDGEEFSHVPKGKQNQDTKTSKKKTSSSKKKDLQIQEEVNA